jgi:hypothetical protein
MHTNLLGLDQPRGVQAPRAGDALPQYTHASRAAPGSGSPGKACCAGVQTWSSRASRRGEMWGSKLERRAGAGAALPGDCVVEVQGIWRADRSIAKSGRLGDGISTAGRPGSREMRIDGELSFSGRMRDAAPRCGNNQIRAGEAAPAGNRGMRAPVRESRDLVWALEEKKRYK